MFQTYNFGLYETSVWEFFVAFFFITAILSIAFFYQKLKQGKNPEYRFYTKALTIKLLGSISFFGIYAYYYKGGDSISYFETSLIYKELFFNDINLFFKTYFSSPTFESFSEIRQFGLTPYTDIFFDQKTNFVVKVATPMVILSGGSYLLSSLFISYLFFLPIWNLFRAFLTICPNYSFVFISCFGIPSVVFWSGSISKDTITLAGTAILMTQMIVFNNLPNEKKFRSILKASFGGFLLIFTKPYVIIALFPAFIVWSLSSTIKNKISNAWVRVFAYPTLMFIGVVVSYLILNLFGESLDKFAVDKALETASETQRDLKKDYYQGQSFDIGDFEPNLPSVLSKFPIATFAGTFYPLPGQVSGLVPNLSVLENIIIIAIIIYILFNRFFFQLRYSMNINSKDFLTFFIIYCILFAFMIGLSTSNFGALVRFRIPMTPFLMMIILTHLHYFKNRNVLANNI
jgi:hypothetical protein